MRSVCNAETSEFILSSSSFSLRSSGLSTTSTVFSTTAVLESSELGDSTTGCAVSVGVVVSSTTSTGATTSFTFLLFVVLVDFEVFAFFFEAVDFLAAFLLPFVVLVVDFALPFMLLYI